MKTAVKKPIGTIISKEKAIEICQEWHGGQWSALYSFLSTGRYLDEKYNDYMAEISENKPCLDLIRLKKFFNYKHWEANQH